MLDRLHDLPYQAAGLVVSLARFQDAAEFRHRFFGDDAADQSDVHAVEAGLCAVENHFGELADWLTRAENEVWINNAGNPYNAKVPARYRRLWERGAIGASEYQALYDMRAQRNRLTHHRPEVEPDLVFDAATVAVPTATAASNSLMHYMLTKGYS